MICLFPYEHKYAPYYDIELQSVKSNIRHCDAFKAQHKLIIVFYTCIIHHCQRIVSIADSSRILPKKTFNFIQDYQCFILFVWTLVLNLHIVRIRDTPHTFTKCTPSIIEIYIYISLKIGVRSCMYVCPICICINSKTTARLIRLFMYVVFVTCSVASTILLLHKSHSELLGVDARCHIARFVVGYIIN